MLCPHLVNMSVFFVHSNKSIIHYYYDQAVWQKESLLLLKHVD